MDKQIIKAQKKLQKNPKIQNKQKYIKIASVVLISLLVLLSIVGGILYIVWTEMGVHSLEEAQQQFINAWTKVSLFLGSFSMAFLINKMIGMITTIVSGAKGVRKTLFENIVQIQDHISNHLNHKSNRFDKPYFGLLARQKSLFFTNPNCDYGDSQYAILADLYTRLQTIYAQTKINHNTDLDDSQLQAFKSEIANAKGALGYNTKSCSIKVVNPKALAKYPELLICYLERMMELLRQELGANYGYKF